MCIVRDCGKKTRTLWVTCLFEYTLSRYRKLFQHDGVESNQEPEGPKRVDLSTWLNEPGEPHERTNVTMLRSAGVYIRFDQEIEELGFLCAAVN